MQTFLALALPQQLMQDSHRSIEDIWHWILTLKHEPMGSFPMNSSGVDQQWLSHWTEHMRMWLEESSLWHVAFLHHRHDQHQIELSSESMYSVWLHYAHQGATLDRYLRTLGYHDPLLERWQEERYFHFLHSQQAVLLQDIWQIRLEQWYRLWLHYPELLQYIPFQDYCMSYYASGAISLIQDGMQLERFPSPWVAQEMMMLTLSFILPRVSHLSSYFASYALSLLLQECHGQDTTEAWHALLESMHFIQQHHILPLWQDRCFTSLLQRLEAIHPCV
ncbi:hypothetical protein PVA45_07955 (plasmid) [Entomospira entomophila]|uniref:Uncharacterized protein n=1 Tax=Entomospira entomophila TaxID=2719988 RepID=A0A968GD80_9SPIO|nr:hypothetical protein [Entomospira entomophilus]NIZ41438.1 hypothetical protein [Entomospira entomophilus]WDI36388.1 hypothetical protein PVA45_07955 [Entomospira entomophilus]